MAVDWLDPCARAVVLREAYMGLISGEREQSVRITNGDHVSDVAYSKVDLATLRGELRQAEAECAALNGTPIRRFAIRAGSRRG